MTTRFNKETKGKFCLFRKGSKAYDDFWTEEYIKCRNGLTINGYTLPETFTWDGTPLAGYWVSKYEVSAAITNN